MATYYIIAMRDMRADIYAMPEMWHAKEQAIRAFEDRCNSGKLEDLVARHPQDFELIILGEYEDHTGTILEYKTPDRGRISVGQKTAI